MIQKVGFLFIVTMYAKFVQDILKENKAKENIFRLYA